MTKATVGALTTALSKIADQHRATHERLKAEYGEDFDRDTGHSFGLNKAEVGEVNKWLKSLLPEILRIQNPQMKAMDLEDMIDNQPYYGAIGGGVSYTFTGTSLGTICVVKESTTGKELNVNEATDWYFFG